MGPQALGVSRRRTQPASWRARPGVFAASDADAGHAPFGLQGNHHPLDQRLAETYMLQKGDAAPNTSGRQELLENLINEFA
jgi:hypothetical protein